MTANMEVWVTISTKEDSGLFSSYCDELGLASSGATKQEAEANLKHGILAFCTALRKRDLLERRLTEKGIKYEYRPSKITDHRELIPVLV